jgi:hypothetical protein
MLAGKPQPQFVNPKVQQLIVWCLWTISIPLWFLFECWKTKKNMEKLERLKYGQQLAEKFWIAIAAILLVLFFGKDIGRARPCAMPPVPLARATSTPSHP